MSRSLNTLAILLAVFSLSSCFKEDRKVEPHPRGNVVTDTIPMTENYLHQVYFSLDSAKIVKTVIKTTYDLGFDCSTNGGMVILNTADFMKVADLGEVPFGQHYDTTGMKLRFDKSDGNPDSNAIGKWYRVEGNDTLSNSHVYAVSRGMDELGNPLGLYQVIFDSLRSGVYHFRYAPLAGGQGVAGQVAKDPAVNYRFFSLKSGTVVDAEPPAKDYDLQFTQYTTLLYTDQGIPYPYLVTGVLLNRDGVAAVADSSLDFQAITREQALLLNYSTSLDVIGYDWKYYSFSSGVYTIRPNLHYLVHTGKGFYYKLRFIAFYSGAGLKGYPVMEFQRL